MLGTALLVQLASWAAPQPCFAQRTVRVDKKGAELSVPSQAWLSLVETGADIEFELNGRWQSVNFPATRVASQYFLNWPQATIKVRSVAQSASFDLQSQCQPPDLKVQNWITESQQLADLITDGKNSPNLSGRIQALIATSSNPLDRARSTQLLANYYLKESQFQLSERRFFDAANEYILIAQPALSGISLLGAVEALDRSNKSHNSLTHALKAQEYLRNSPYLYFLLRASERICIDGKQANISKLLACVRASALAYAQLGEDLDALASALDVAQYQRANAEEIDFKPAIKAYDTLEDKAENAVHMGRFWLFSALLARDQGKLASSFAFFQSALQYFAKARQHSERWHANTYSQISDLYIQLGLFEQAEYVLLQALKNIDPAHQPLRAASIFQRLGEQNAAQNETQQSAHWFSTADHIRQLMGADIDRKSAAIVRAEVLLDQEPSSKLYQAIEDLLPIPASGMERYFIVKARLLLRLARVDEAAELLGKISANPKALLPKLSVALARSELALAQLDLTRAQTTLSGLIRALAETADQSHTSALAYLTLRSGERVRRAWVDAQTPTSDPAMVFQTALLANPARFMTSVISPIKAEQSVAKQSAGEVGFLVQLAGPQASAPERFKAVNIPALADFQKRLSTDGSALILVPGDKQTLALWITSQRTNLILLVGHKQIQEQIQVLAHLLAEPITAPMASEAAASALSATLFKDVPASPAPKRLWIVADELSAAIPFSTLYWPGSSEPLLSQTDISLITGMRANAGQPAALSRHKAKDSVFFAPAYRAASKQLQSLDFASVERAGIERESGSTWQAFVGQSATRDAFQDLLQSPGVWLHVAAHGRADPGVLGHAGLWLANADGPDADFLSWLELGNLRSQVELLVLNACQSATGAQPSRQANISFALAMSTSGAHHVVAALWPVSDVASGTWIPEFYRHLALTHQADTSAAALRQAQLRLYESPHYRHPFYWASLVHFQRLDF